MVSVLYVDVSCSIEPALHAEEVCCAITQRSLDRDQQVLAMFTDPRIACFATSALRLPRIEYKQSGGQKDALLESRRSHIAKR